MDVILITGPGVRGHLGCTISQTHNHGLSPSARLKRGEAMIYGARAVRKAVRLAAPHGLGKGPVPMPAGGLEFAGITGASTPRPDSARRRLGFPRGGTGLRIRAFLKVRDPLLKICESDRVPHQLQQSHESVGVSSVCRVRPAHRRTLANVRWADSLRVLFVRC